MGVKRYRKKPVEVTGVLYTGENDVEIFTFVGCRPGGATPPITNWRPAKFVAHLGLDEGEPAKVWNTSQKAWNSVNPGDTILRGLVGEFYPCSPDALAKTYDEVEGPA